MTDFWTNLLASIWPIIIAVIITIAVILDFIKNESKDHNSLMNSMVLQKISTESNFKFDTLFNESENVDDPEINSRDLSLIQSLSNELADVIEFEETEEDPISVKDMFLNSERFNLSLREKVSLGWIVVCISIMAFLIARMCFYYYIYTGDGLLVAWFIYYIIIGLIEFYGKK